MCKGPLVEVLSDADALAARAADWLVGVASNKRGLITIALSGGSTPKRLYQRLASSHREVFPWTRTHWFWGDERYVPHDDEHSNYRMARESLFAHINVPPSNIHPINTSLTDPLHAAAAYEAELKSFYGAGRLDPARPLFDVILLGLGTDGHTASLFPGDPVLEERKAWVGVTSGGQRERRITLTYPVLESSSSIAFLVTGKAKKQMAARLLARDATIPAGRLSPLGEIRILLDRDAS